MKKKTSSFPIIYLFLLTAFLFDCARLARRILPVAGRKLKKRVRKLRNEPGSANDLANDAPLLSLLSKEEFELDLKRKQQMGVDELTWEKKLESNLGNYYLPIYKRAKLKGEATSWDFVTVDPMIPTVLVIGDSISRGYTMPLRAAILGTANLLRAPENCGNTKNGLKKFDLYTEGIAKIDVLVLNFGIHDRNLSPVNYERNLTKVLSKSLTVCSSVIFISTTPFFPQMSLSSGSIKNAFEQFDKWYKYGRGMDEGTLNLIAESVCNRLGIHYLDLGSTVGEENLVLNRKRNDVHFPEEYYATIAGPIATEIKRRF